MSGCSTVNAQTPPVVTNTFSQRFSFHLIVISLNETSANGQLLYAPGVCFRIF